MKESLENTYSEAEVEAMFAVAAKEDVDLGGRFDARAMAIILWDEETGASKTNRDVVASLHFRWNGPRASVVIQCDNVTEFDKAVLGLGELERKALGSARNGIEQPHRWLTTEASTAVAEPGEEEHDDTVCPKCSATYHHQFTHCPRCHVELVSAPRRADNAGDEADSNRKTENGSSPDVNTAHSALGKDLMENDNVGTRCETEGRADVYFASLFEVDPEPIIFYFFDTKEQATQALADVSCMGLAADTERLICTEILTFGVFPARDRDDSKTWGALLAGKNLNHGLWSEARESFIRHGGRMRREDAPSTDATPSQTDPRDTNRAQLGAVEFVREIDLSEHGGVGTKMIYEAPDRASALEFLKAQDTDRPYFYVEITTPAGGVGKDKDGVYEF